MSEQREQYIENGQLVSHIYGTYQMLAKDEEGVPQIFTLERDSKKVRPLPEGMDNPYIRQAPEMQITPSRAKRAERVGVQVIAVIPDEQIGYRYINGEYVPTHDEKAMSAARNVMKLMKPDILVAVGDTLDFPTFSKYPADSTHFIPQTTQMAIDRAAQWHAELAADHPEATKISLAGNHDERLTNYVLKNAREVSGLRRGMATPDEWPVLSIQYLLRAEETGWNYITPYGASWSPDGETVFTHGDVVRSNGSTAEAMSKRYPNQNVFFGHVHRHEAHTRTNHEGQTHIAETFGTLARIDGAVPSVGNLVDARGEIVPRYENWVQGLGRVAIFESGAISSEFVEIYDGIAHYRDELIPYTE